MTIPGRRLPRNAGSSLVGYAVLLGALALTVVYFSGIFKSINDTTKSASGYTTPNGSCSQADSTAGVFAKVAHAANCK
jgi:hypothetical protein